jgi:TonB-dependent SusC/RagA subfamily outer membrane receptor
VIVSDSIIFRETGKNPLIILDGKVQINAEINKINPSSIEKMEVLKNGSATVLYGDAGKNGVIIITSKAASNAASVKIIEPYASPIPKNAVYYVDGVKVDSSALKKIEPSKIATVNIWKGEKAMNKFGVDEGVGVIEIITKKATGLITVQDVKLEKVQVTNVPRGVFANVDGHSTVYFGESGKSNASIDSYTDLIVVNGKLLSPAEVNSTYKCSDFVTGGAIDPKTVNGKTRKGVLFLSSSSINLKDMLALIEKVLA